MSVRLDMMPTEKIVASIERALRDNMRAGAGHVPRDDECENPLRVRIVGCLGCAALSAARRHPDVPIADVLMRPCALNLEMAELRDGLLRHIPQADVTLCSNPIMCCWSARLARRLRRQCRGADVAIAACCPSGEESLRTSLEGLPVTVVRAMRVTGFEAAYTQMRGFSWRLRDPK